MNRTDNIVRGASTTDLVNNLVTAVSVISVTAGSTTYAASAVDGYSITNGANSFSLTWAGIDQPAQGVTYTVSYTTAEPSILIHGTDYVKAAFVSALRAAFAAQTWFPLYRYSTNDTLSGISIHESFPKHPFKAPALIVGVGSMAVNRNTLSETDQLSETRGGNGVINGFFSWGSLTPLVKIQVAALTDSDRRKMADITALFCRHLFTRLFARYGIGYKQITVVGESDQDWQGQTLYLQEIQIPCYTEFQVLYPVDLVDIIDNLQITVTPEL